MAGAGGLSPAGRRVRDQIAAAFPDRPLVVALSGGADSAVCAWAARESQPRARAVTIDHGLPASPQLVAAAASVARFLGLEHTVIAAPAADDEDSLRRARYAALEGAATPEEIIVTAHTADDQAETILGNILRGAGAAGLGGMPPGRGRFLRPMLSLTRAEVRRLAFELGLPFVDDPDNVALRRRRSRLRTEALPYLEERFNPSLRRALLRLGRFAQADEAAIAARADRIPVLEGSGVVRIPASALATLPEAVAARAARRALRLIFEPYPGRSGDVEAVLEVSRGAGNSASLSEGFMAAREGPWVTLYRALPSVPQEAPLAVPGEARFGTWTFRARRADREPWPRPLGRRIAVLSGRAGNLVVRACLPGDRIALHQGTKPAFEALAEAGVPVRLRPVWPALFSDGTMVWLVGARLDPAWRAVPGESVTIVEGAE